MTPGDKAIEHPEVQKAILESTQMLIKAIAKTGCVNPKLESTINIDNGEKYKLIFERIDAD